MSWGRGSADLRTGWIVFLAAVGREWLQEAGSPADWVLGWPVVFGRVLALALPGRFVSGRVGWQHAPGCAWSRDVQGMTDMAGEIERVGVLGGGAGVAVADVQAALAAGPVALEHGELFTGRPSTHLFVSDAVVVKLHPELGFSPRDMHRWVERTLERERELAVWHPERTWFLLQSEEGPVPGNATPRLQALHTLFAGEARPGRALDCLEAAWELYLRAAAQGGVRLDEGLSNYGVDAGGAVYYLDDDLYRWDRFLSLTQWIGQLLRQYGWLDEAAMARLGEALGQGVRRHFGEPHWLRVIAEELRAVFLASDAQRAAAQAVVGALDAVYRAGSQPAPSAQDGPAEETGRLPSPPGDGQALDGGDEPWAVLADVHANLPALERVLDEMHRLGLRRGLVLGDSVGYGPHPGACIERLADSGLHCLMGNHDNAAAADATGRGFSPNARWVIDWTRPQLSAEQRAWLAELPLYLAGEGWLAVHGAPRDRTFFHGYVYQQTFEENLEVLAQRGLSVCFHGHSHMRGVFYARGSDHGRMEEPALDLSRVDQALVCPGSVGQPRGGAAGTEFAVWSPGTRRLELQRLEYDPEPTLRDMAAAGFPQALSERLLHGQ